MADCTETLCDAVLDAVSRRSPLRIAGAGSKSGYCGRDVDAAPLDVTGHRGIVDYQPDELVISARAGTPIAELNAALAARGQMLPAECPLFGGSATLGGSVACNASGPGRPWRGALRDSILGVQFINGRGELLRYGGTVMKNVAGYDVSRLHAGAQGTLGLITEVTLRVLPRPASDITLAYSTDCTTAIERMLSLSALPEPISGACWQAGTLYLRLSGSESTLSDFRRRQGGDAIDEGTPWDSLDTLATAPFADDAPLWRLSLAPGSAVTMPAPDVVDWGGAQRFYSGEQDATEMHATAELAGGRAQLWRGGDRRSEVNGPVPEAAQTLHRRLKSALDPFGVFNPGRVYGWL